MVIESGPFDFGNPADFRDTDLAQGFSFHQFAHLIRDPDLGNVEIRNRVVMVPMGVGFAPGENRINDAYVRYFEK